MSTETGARYERLATRLHFGAIHLMRRLRRADEVLGLSPAELSTLSTLVNRGALTMSELAAAEQVRPPTMTRRAQKLEIEGYVLRQPSEADGRVSLIRHTSRAWMALQSAADSRARLLSSALADLSGEEIQNLEIAADLIERLARVSASDG